MEKSGLSLAPDKISCLLSFCFKLSIFVLMSLTAESISASVSSTGLPLCIREIIFMAPDSGVSTLVGRFNNLDLADNGTNALIYNFGVAKIENNCSLLSNIKWYVVIHLDQLDDGFPGCVPDRQLVKNVGLCSERSAITRSSFNRCSMTWVVIVPGSSIASALTGLIPALFRCFFYYII